MVKNSRPNQNGSSLIELPVALTVFFVFLLFPLIDFATIALRSASVYAAASNAAHSGALANSFLKDASITDPSSGTSTVKLSAVNSAVQSAQATKANGLAGVAFADQDVSVRVVGVPLRPADGLPTIQGKDRQALKIVDPAYLYEVEVTVAAQIQPLFSLSQQLFGDIPGITTPLPLKVTSQQVCESPEGFVQ